MQRLFKKRFEARRWLARHPRAVPAAIFALAAALALLGTFAIERGKRQSEAAQLRERAGAVASALERRANSSSAYLRAGAALFAIRSGLQGAQFRDFVSELRLDADNRGAEAIGWAQRIDPDQVDAFNRVMALDHGPEVRLHPQLGPGKAYALPVTYLEPDNERNRRVLGFDSNSEPIRRAAMAQAERTARPTASGRLMLLQDRAQQTPGFTIYMPVFVDVPGGARLRGFVFSTFDAKDFLASGVQPAELDEFGIRLYDQGVGPGRLMAATGRKEFDGMRARSSVSIANHGAVLELTARRDLPLSGLSSATLIFGLAFALLLALLARMLAQQAVEDGARLGWYEEQISIRESLTRELNHRVKNTLASVLSIVALTRRRAATIDEFAEGLDGRIRALSATHDLLTRSQWGSTPVRAIIEAEVAPYSRGTGPVIALDGPDIELAPNDALSLGLAIHELATNAAKYGALSVPEGRVTIEWSRAEDGQARIAWREEGGPPVPTERGRGFGMDLIEKVVAHELQNPVEIEFDPAGVRCELIVPVRKANPFEIRQSTFSPP